MNRATPRLECPSWLWCRRSSRYTFVKNRAEHVRGASASGSGGSAARQRSSSTSLPARASLGWGREWSPCVTNQPVVYQRQIRVWGSIPSASEARPTSQRARAPGRLPRPGHRPDGPRQREPVVGFLGPLQQLPTDPTLKSSVNTVHTPCPTRTSPVPSPATLRKKVGFVLSAVCATAVPLPPDKENFMPQRCSRPCLLCFALQ